MADDPHDEVRARLAAEPRPAMPEDVAARLHDALANEADSRRTTGTTDAEEAATGPTVTPLPRRGRWKAPLLAAAGVVAVVAIGIPVINQTTNQSDDAGVGSAEHATRSESAADAPDSSPPDSSSQAGPQKQPESMVQRFRETPMDLHRASFGADVSRYLGSTVERTASSALRGDVAAIVSCQGSRPSAPRGLEATLDGTPAVVLASPAQSGDVRVRAVVCGADGPALAAQTTLDSSSE